MRGRGRAEAWEIAQVGGGAELAWGAVVLAWLPLPIAAVVVLGCSAPRSAEVYRLAADHEPVDSLILGWTGDAVDSLEQIVAVASSRVPIVLVVDPAIGRLAVSDRLAALGVAPAAVRLVEHPLEAPWVRDFGPLSVVGDRGHRAIIDFDYVARPSADGLPRRIAGELWPDAVVVEPGIEIEGGNLIADGAGACLMAEAPWIDASPDLLRAFMRRFLGCERLIELRAMDGEPTGHVDMFVFVPAPGQAVVGAYDAAIDPVNADVLDYNAALLAEAGFQVSRIPMPSHADGKYRSYTNLLAIGDLVLLPVYPGHDADADAAARVVSRAYPGREIVAIDSSDSIVLDGALHCLAQTVPARFVPPGPAGM